MSFLNEFWSQYGSQIILGIMTAIGGAIGIVAKNIYKRVCDDKTKKEVCEQCVKAAEQVYKELTGSERYDKVLKAAKKILANKGISITELELKVYIEAAVGEANNVFKNSGPNKEEEPKEEEADVAG